MRQSTLQAAGVDLGAHEMVACGPDGADQPIVRTLGTDPADLQTLADWLVDRGLQTVAMDSTGVYGMPRFAALAARGLHCGLSRAASLTRGPGRQRDVLDWQWMQTLHRYGLRTASLRPAAARVAVRTLWRHRAPLLAHRAPPVLHRPPALLQMNRPLAPALALFDFSTSQRSAGEAQSERVVSVVTPRCETTDEASEATPPCPPPRRKPHSHSQHAPEGTSRAHLLRITGGDLVAVHGMRDAIAQTMVAELGTDRSQWPDAQHFGSWLGLAPKNDISGGKVLKSRTLKHRNRAPQAFRMAAQSVSRSPCAFGAFSRRLKGRLGPAQALGATAHKSARTVDPLRKPRGQDHALGAAE